MKETAGIWELRRATEEQTGHPAEIYSAYPVVGRGSIIHDMAPHEEVEERFEKALRISFRKRLSFFINRILRHA